MGQTLRTLPQLPTGVTTVATTRLKSLAHLSSCLNTSEDRGRRPRTNIFCILSTCMEHTTGFGYRQPFKNVKLKCENDNLSRCHGSGAPTLLLEAQVGEGARVQLGQGGLGKDHNVLHEVDLLDQVVVKDLEEVLENFRAGALQLGGHEAGDADHGQAAVVELLGLQLVELLLVLGLQAKGVEGEVPRHIVLLQLVEAVALGGCPPHPM